MPSVCRLLLLSAFLPAIAAAQPPAARGLAPPPPATQSADAAQPAANLLDGRAPYDFAPGVLTVIPPDVDRSDVISLHDIVELRTNEPLAWTPAHTTESRTLYEMAENAVFINEVWCLEFAFKPMRMITVDIPQPNGRLQRKNVWYMVYRVRNVGAGLAGAVEQDGTYITTEKPPEPIRFIPELTLVSHDRSGGQRVSKAYLDRIVPTALGPIRQRELPEGELLHSAQLPTQELAVEAGRAQRGAWGVAMWTDVDPRIDFFSIYVGGLSNAYQWTDPEGAYKLGDPVGTGRRFTWKTLQLNFWRPGDELDQSEREIRYGAAPGYAEFYDAPEGVASRWVYR